MESLWIYLTVGAGFLQAIRTGLQKHLTNHFTGLGVTFIRFGVGFPGTIAFVVLLHYGFAMAWPDISWAFIARCALSAAIQIVATVLLMKLFTRRNFAVGVVYMKTEVLQTALLGMVLFGETLTGSGWIAVVIGFTGIFFLSLTRGKVEWRKLYEKMDSRSTQLGLASGFCFSINALLLREASLTLSDIGEPFMQAGITLMVMTGMQTVGLLIYILCRPMYRAELARYGQHLKPILGIGVLSVAASIGWFTAFTMQSAAYVKTVGQVELVFTVLITHMVFKERFSRLEAFGIALIVVSILWLMLFK